MRQALELPAPLSQGWYGPALLLSPCTALVELSTVPRYKPARAS